MHHGMTWGRQLWPVVLIIVSLLIIVPETWALLTNWSNTLSDYARYELGINTFQVPLDKHTAAWFLTLILWSMFAGWLTYHIWLEVGLKVLWTRKLSN